MGRRSSRRRRIERQPDPVSRHHRKRLAAVIGGVGVLAIGVAGLWLRSASVIHPSAVSRDGSPAWSPDATRIAFYSERDGNGEIYVMNADGSNRTRLTSSAADEGYPTWSPDGRTITFDSDRDGNFEIYAMNPDGTNTRRLTNSPSRDVSASWSPDGSKIAFMSDRGGGFDVYVMSADGSNVERRTTTSSSWFPVWSPDGSMLAFHVGRDVHVARADGTALHRLTMDPANGMYPTWSPDGRQIAFMSWRTGRTELFVMSADGSNQRKLLGVERGDAIDPRWSPDASQITFVHMPDGMDGAERAICVVSADGTNLRRLSR